MFRRLWGGAWMVAAVAILGLALIPTTPAQADIFTFTSCHISNSTCNGGSVSSGFGTVELTQRGNVVDFDLVLFNGNRFIQTGAGDNQLFLFNDSLTNSTVTNVVATLNTNVVTISGGLAGSTNTLFHADGTGNFTAGIHCASSSGNCDQPGQIAQINDLHFTVTNATLLQLETANATGNLFAADIICGSTQTGCGTGLTGPVDVSTPGVVPEPTTLLLVGTVLVGLGAAWRRRWAQTAAV